MRKFVPLAGAAGWLVSGDWLVGLCLTVLALIWVTLPAEEGPPVLALAATMQWVSVTLGLFYFQVTGRALDATLRGDYRMMVLLGLGCVVAMVVGLVLGRGLIERLPPKEGLRPAHALTFKTLVLVYVIYTAALAAASITAIDFGGLAMAMVALSYLRLGLLYLLMRRFVARSESVMVAGVLAL